MAYTLPAGSPSLWVPTNGDPILVSELGTEHLLNICDYLTRIMTSDENVESLRFKLARGRIWDESYDTFIRDLSEMSPGQVVAKAYPAAPAIRDRVRALKMGSFLALDTVEHPWES